MNTKNLNIETRISNRAQSIFAAFGQTINDFYLEAGIYFVGGFNAALVAWNIYTSLITDGQPLLYAIILAAIAFVAVEGLAVYLVGAAAKTNNVLLWFFSVVFATFFTYAHYQEMSRRGVIAQYITLAIPFFVVVGYWARTVKINVEAERTQTAKQLEDEAARRQQLEDEERQHQIEIDTAKRDYQIEQAQLNAKHQRHMAEQATELKHAEKLARIEAGPKAQLAGNLPEPADRNGNLPEWLPEVPATLSRFRQLIGNGAIELPADLSGAELGRIIGRSPRTGQNWLMAARNGNGYKLNS